MHRRNTVALKQLHDHLDLLGMRHRRIHDFRRTFITLSCRTRGDHEILKRMTHTKSAGSYDTYRDIPWEDSCTELSRFKI